MCERQVGAERDRPGEDARVGDTGGIHQRGGLRLSQKRTGCINSSMVPGGINKSSSTRATDCVRILGRLSSTGRAPLLGHSMKTSSPALAGHLVGRGDHARHLLAHHQGRRHGAPLHRSRPGSGGRRRGLRGERRLLAHGDQQRCRNGRRQSRRRGRVRQRGGDRGRAACRPLRPGRGAHLPGQLGRSLDGHPAAGSARWCCPSRVCSGPSSGA